MSSEPIISEPVAEPTTPVSEPVATPTPEPTSPASWRDSLSIDHRDNPALADFKDVDSLAKSYIHQGKLVGADKIVIPKEDASPEERDAFYQKLGRPAKAEDYDLAGVEVPEGVPWDAEFQSSMVETMHKLGLNQQQVQGVLGAYIESIGGQYQEATGEAARNRDAGIQDLRNEWGKSFDGQVDLAKRAFMAGAGDKFEEVASIPLEGGGLLGDHPAVIRAFAALGGKMSEHGLVGATATRTTLTPGEATNEMNKLKSDPEFLKAYLDGSHLEHDAAVKRINDLTLAEVGSAG